MKKELSDKVYELLKKHENPLLKLSYYSIYSDINPEDLINFHKFLSSKPVIEHKFKRQKCPIKRDYSRGFESIYKWKKSMVNYISKNGFKFQNGILFPSSLLEAIANYVDSLNRI